MTERVTLTGWDRTAYILSCYSNAVGYAINMYVAQGIPRDELEGAAIDALFELADKFPAWCEEQGCEPNGALFWTLLKTNIDHKAWKLRKRYRPQLSYDDLTTGEDGAEVYYGRILLSAADLARLRRWSPLHESLADAIAMFPTRWKILLALRYHHELAIAEVASIVGQNPPAVTALLTVITRRLLDVALHETTSTEHDVEPVRSRGWDIPFTVHRWVWLNTPHVDVYAWLGSVQRDYLVDVSYLVDMLDRANSLQIQHGSRGVDIPARWSPCGTESAYVRHLKRGEPVDHACLEAHAAYKTRRLSQRRADEAARARGETVPDRRRRENRTTLSVDT